jgi:anti-sigma factor RsiW
LQAWLATHPEAQAEAELDAALDAALNYQSDAPVASNFTARVMQTIVADARREMRPIAPARNWWHKLMPRMALVAAVLCFGTLAYRQHLVGKQKDLTGTAREIAGAQPLASATVIADFEVIRSLTPETAVADEKLLALSEELLAFNP